MSSSIAERIRAIRPSGVVAVLALCLAIGGTAVAAKSITGKQVKNNSLTGKDIKDETLSPDDFNGSVEGPQGPAGQQGQTGPAGSAVAYAMVNGAGTLNGARSKNIVSVESPSVAPGYYCINVSVPTVNAVASLANTASGEFSITEGDPLTSCSNAPDFSVQTLNSSGGVVDKPFWIAFN